MASVSSLDMGAESLLVERADGVVTVTFNRPHRKNAIPATMWIEIADTFNAIARNGDDRVVIVTGAGGDFSSGADLSTDGRDAVPAHQLAAMRFVGAACLAVANVPQPTIAKVSGVAVGAGMNLALMCDLVIADTTARFSEIFAKRGLSIDFGGSWILPRRIGLHRAKELTLLGDIVDAAEADRIGLVNRVVDPADLDATVAELARRLAAGPPIALAQSKRLLNESFDTTLAQALDDEGAAQTVNFGTEDTIEAFAAFVGKQRSGVPRPMTV